VKKRQFETCTECGEIFKCAIFKRRKVEEWPASADNLRQIKKDGLDLWLKEQKERQTLLESLLQNYNEGRSMSFYCKVCKMMPIDLINTVIERAKTKIASKKINKSDIKARAKIVKSTIKDIASKSKFNMD